MRLCVVLTFFCDCTIGRVTYPLIPESGSVKLRSKTVVPTRVLLNMSSIIKLRCPSLYAAHLWLESGCQNGCLGRGGGRGVRTEYRLGIALPSVRAKRLEPWRICYLIGVST